MSWIGVGVAVAGAVVADQQQRKATKAQEEAQEVEDRVEAIRARNQQAQQIEEQRVKQAQAAAAGQASGGVESSAVSGVQSSLATQAGTAQGAINTSLAASQAIGDLNKQASAFMQDAGRAQAVGSIGQTIASANLSRNSNKPQEPAKQ